MPLRKQKVLPPGTVLRSPTGVPFVIGNLIGKGGFGHIYGLRNSDKVVKVEPATSGGLYAEISIYRRFLRGVPRVPTMFAAGVQTVLEDSYRFMVLSRLYPSDPATLYTKRNLGILLSTLRVLHDRGITHGDIKPENILYNEQNEPVLIDFSCSSAILAPGDKNQRVARPAGTLIFCSLDAHEHKKLTRRGDLQNLFFVFLDHFYPLPWAKYGKKYQLIQQSKQELLESIPRGIPDWLFNFGEQVGALGFHEMPSYEVD